jgi:hypothetical protein
MSTVQTAAVPDPNASREDCMRFLLRFTSALPPQVRARAALARAKTQMTKYLKTQLPRALITAAIGFAIGWLINVYLMRGKYGGFNVPKGGTATGKGNLLHGTLFWFVLATVVTAVVSYRLKAGKGAFGRAVKEFPGKVRGFVQQDRSDAVVHLLWGFAGAMVVVLLVGPAITGIIAAGFLLFVGTAFREMAMGLLQVVWYGVLKRVAPKFANPPSPAAAAVSTMAGLAAMLVGWVVPGRGVRFALAVAAGVGAFFLGKQRRSTKAVAAAAMLLAPLAFVTVMALVPQAARADDGGSSECGGSYSNCPGTDKLMEYAAAGGAAAAAGALVGDLVGEAAAGEGPGKEKDDDPPGGGGKPPCGPEEAARTIKAWDNWQKANPGGSWDDFMGGRIAQSRAEAQAVGMQLDQMQREAKALDDQLAAMQDSIREAQTPWNEMTKTQQQALQKRVITAYHQAHPKATADEVNRFTGRFQQDPNLTGLDMLQYVAGESLIGLPGATWDAGANTLGMIGAAPEFIKNVAGSYWEDLTSGAQSARLKEVFVDPVGMLVSDLRTKGVGGVLSDAKKNGMNLTTAGAKQFDQAVRAFDEAVKTGDGKGIAKAIDGVAGQLLSDYILTAGAGKVVNLARSGLEATGLVKTTQKAEQVAEWSEKAKGIPLDTPEKRAAAGFSENATKAFQGAVDEHGATLQMQKRGADAVGHEGTAYMKPQGAKSMKSVGPMDAELGGPKSEGLLAFYKPVDPLAAAGSPIQKRFEMLQTLYESVPGKDLAAKQAYISKSKLEVWVSGKKVKLDVKFDAEGVLRATKDGKAIVSDYDGWAVLDKEGERRLGYDAAGKRLTGEEKQADRKTKIPLIRKLVDNPATQLQHAPASSEWGPIPAMLAGAEPTPCFDCKTLAIARNILNNVAKEGAVEFRPGAAHPYLTKPVGIPDAPQPTLHLPGAKGPAAPAGPKPIGPKAVPVPRPTGGGNNKK